VRRESTAAVEDLTEDVTEEVAPTVVDAPVLAEGILRN
jgi:hypothetical protein